MVESKQGTERSPALVVGLGGSAGALESYEAFFQNLPASTPAAFVLVQHLDPARPTLLPELLGRMTSLPVQVAQQGTALAPGHLYVAQPGTTLAIEGSALVVAPLESKDDRFRPIDHFFQSLARLGERALAIILSGSGSDGVAGAQSVRQAGGLVLAQAPDLARFDGMPRNAIAAGAVHHVMAPSDMPALVLARLRQLSPADGPPTVVEALPLFLPQICEIVHARTGHDFTSYKKATILRRLEKRVHSRRCASVEEYVELLREDPEEALALRKELLIGVTRFFRDPEVFVTLSHQILPLLCRNREDGSPVRVWVPACSTGEEAYSLAMLFRECADRHGLCPTLTLFATDVDPAAVEAARHGIYGRAIEEQLSKERLERFFVRTGTGYRVGDELRDLCTFAVHNLLRDPPFSKMDLISCRNLFIYFESAGQARLLPVFHYALAPEGYLVLGSAEGILGPSELFHVVDKKHRIYQRREGASRPELSFPFVQTGRPEARPEARALPRSLPDRDLTRAIAAELLESHAPPALVIDERGEILFYAGKTGPYLEPPTGAPSHNAFDVIARSIRPEAHALLHRVIKSGREAVHPNAVLDAGGLVRKVDLVARPLRGLLNGATAYLLVFRASGAAAPLEQAEREDLTLQSRDSVVQQLEAELRETREHVQSTIEEVKASNEELLSMNEELQSANEELGSAKEEYQSLNEELETVNSELSKKLDELDRANADLQNFLENTRVPALFLDGELRLNKFTPAADQLFRLIPTDLGRPFGDIASSLPTGDLEAQFREVLRTLAPLERELVTLDGSHRHYLMRVNPYRTVNNVISGVVVTFSDVTELKKAQEREATLAAIVESSSDAILSLDLEGTVTTWNLGAEALAWYSGREVIGKPLAQLIPESLRAQHRKFEEDVRRGGVVTGQETEILRKDGQRLTVSLTLSPMRGRLGELTGYSVILRDVGERRRAAIERERLGAIVDSSDDAIISKDLNGIVLSWNPAAERLFGYTAEEMIGSPIYKIVPPDHPEDVPRILEAIRRGERVKHYKTVRVCKDGRRIHVSLSVSPIRDELGRLVGASKIARDVTEQVAAEQALEHAVTLRDEFISLASHELKTPLTSMLLQTEIMKRGLARNDPQIQSPDRVAKLAAQYERQLSRLNKLIEDMLDVSRIGTKGLPLTREPVDLSELARETIALLRPSLASAGCSVTEELQPGVVGLWDRVRLEQVLTNLLTNAGRYGQGQPIRVRVKSDGEWATLEVADRGIGIAPEDQERIFGRFERVVTRGGVVGGFGVGLFIVKEVVAAHGGTVRVQSTLGEGATFVVTLPLRPSA